MFKKLECKNYKAFDSFSLELKPLTILLGANSFGKSSILNIILMLAQSVNSNEMADSPLRINGSQVGFGEAENVIKDMNEDNVLSISIESNFDNTHLISSVVENSFDEFRYMLHRFVVSDSETLDEFSQNFYLGENTDNDFYKFSNYIVKELKNIRDSNDAKTRERDKNNPQNVNDYIYRSKFTKTVDYNNLIKLLWGELFNLSELTYELKLNSKTNKLILHSFSLLSESTVFLKIYNDNGTYKLFSEVIDNSDLSNSRKDIVNDLDLNSINLGVVGKYGIFRTGAMCVNPFSKLITTIFKMCSNEFLKIFQGDKVSHVSPLRAFPQRYYLLDKTILRTQINTSDGNELAEVLKKRTDILKKINNLFAKFELLIKVVNVNNIIHRIIVVQNNVNLEITDVGFGISQVLPILVQAYLSPNGSLVIMEQPEIHLHPNMQAWLADALINISINEDKFFIIETHSESIIRRIRRRIAEEDHPLNNDDVAIYNVQRNELNSSAELEFLSINENGDIKWPKGFLDVEMDDMLSIQYSKMNRIKGM